MVVRNGKAGGLGVHRNDPYEFVILCVVGMLSISFLPRPLKICYTPPLSVLKTMFTRARP